MKITFETLSDLNDPRERVLVVEHFVQDLCRACGEDPADGAMMLLTSAALVAMKHGGVPKGEVLTVLMTALGHATDAAGHWWGEKYPAPALHS